jgi:5'-methylthioadenosine phosphorylase
MSTDYDCWRESEEAVTIDMVIATMRKNADNVKLLILNAIPRITYDRCTCREYIKTAIM